MADSTTLIDILESTRKSIEKNLPDYMYEGYDESKASPPDPRVLKLQLIDAQNHKFNLLKEELIHDLKNEFQAFKDKLTLELTEVFRLHRMEMNDKLKVNNNNNPTDTTKPRDIAVSINQAMPFREEGEIRIKFLYPQKSNEVDGEAL
jgi:hypothetical protein